VITRVTRIRATTVSRIGSGEGFIKGSGFVSTKE
jgi:hypothetical protein